MDNTFELVKAEMEKVRAYTLVDNTVVWINGHLLQFENNKFYEVVDNGSILSNFKYERTGVEYTLDEVSKLV